jgi:hypothetical protein
MLSFSSLIWSGQLGLTRKRGVTLIEAVLYIAIALALIVGGLVFFQQASLAQRINGAVRNISAMASETRGLYQSRPNFTGFTHQTLIDAGAIPSTMVTPTGVVNEWGGTVRAGAVTLDDGSNMPNNGFRIFYDGIPPEACARLVVYDGNGVGRVGAGISEIRYRPTGAADVHNQSFRRGADGITPAEAALDCASILTMNPLLPGDGSGRVDLSFHFTR